MHTQKLPTPLQRTQVFCIWIIWVFLLWGTKLAFVKIIMLIIFLKPTNKDTPAALTSYEHLGVQLCS